MTTVGEEMDAGGRLIRLSSLDRVIFPEAGLIKADLLAYYVRVVDAMLPHLRERLLHMHRYPEGVDGPRFWQRACPDQRPDWMDTADVWSDDEDAYIRYCVANELATILWAVNLGSIELHTSLHRRSALERPTTLAFDLEPGEGAGILECGAVGLRLRELLGAAGLECLPKTSGSKGLQVYAPLNTPVSYAQTKPFSRAAAELLERQTPDLVVSRTARKLRAGKVLVDWSQNTEHRSMVCAYSVRAETLPTVSTPVTWEEVTEAVEAGDPSRLAFEKEAVVDRLEEHGELFERVLTLEQELPG